MSEIATIKSTKRRTYKPWRNYTTTGTSILFNKNLIFHSSQPVFGSIERRACFPHVACLVSFRKAVAMQNLTRVGASHDLSLNPLNV